MVQEWGFYLQLISTFSVLFPLVIGLLYFQEIGSVFRYFIGFLIVGFAVDLAGWMFYIIENDCGNHVVRYAYNLFEPLFLIWFLMHLGSNSKLKFLLINAWMIVLPLWLISVFFNDFFSVYKTITQIFIAFISCFCILEVIEKDSKIMSSLAFWILFGIFFYNFCTFFFMSFVNTALGLDLWYLHNIVNVTTNLIYFFGFCFSFRSISKLGHN
ncbi:hypothetical protein [Aquiflexum gelatinilyticum]|uniref:Uncharacterized protein n=1 Tax=Aquiflexum gelatinilyticum TaxID=2961943 RepID=A0A9X2T2J9_9BACT|nr:hypothetical protein [Aquiflexum gelatinilyticum]MCR9015515.1 hypothetical protein [Aquiflexum gelatinilyticum]